MRIAFVAPLVAPICDTTSRGPSVIIADLARGMLARGHDVMVFCAQGSYLRDVPTAPIPLDPRVADAAVVRGARPQANAALASAFDQLFFHLEQWGADVVSQHAFDAEPYALSRHLPTVHTLHLNPTDPGVVDAVRTTRAPLVAVSHDSAHRWHQAGALRLTTISNGVRDFPVTPSAQGAMALIAGRIAPEKGTATALRVARRAGLEPVIVGEVYDRGYFAREVTPLLAGVRLCSTLPRDRVRGLMSRAAVTLMPIEWDEPFGLVAAEAQLAGCPVIGYARGALPEIVPQDVGGALVTPGDEDALVAAIADVRSIDRTKLRASALERFDLTRMIDAHEDLLLEAATGVARSDAAA